MKQRPHTTSGAVNPIDIYPEIDVHVSQAVQIADQKYPDQTVKGYNKKWSTFFHKTIDTILVKEGLRVI